MEASSVHSQYEDLGLVVVDFGGGVLWRLGGMRIGGLEQDVNSIPCSYGYDQGYSPQPEALENHTSQLKPQTSRDSRLFPSNKHTPPSPLNPHLRPL